MKLHGNTATEVKCCYCCSKGITKLTAHLDKSQFYPTDKAVINIAIDNSASTQNIQEI